MTSETSIRAMSLNEAFRLVLKPEKRFYQLSLIYSIGIGLLTVGLPAAVQLLITLVANTALPELVLIVTLILLGVLTLAASLAALREYTMELFNRSIIARLVRDISCRLVYARQSYFEGVNRSELVNRFFEIMHIQKNVPILLIDGFAVALQGIVGLIVVSFYHPFLFIYNVIFAIIIYLIIKIWGHSAIRSSLALSTSKYDLVRWLEEISRVNYAFKAHNPILFALQKADYLCSDYLLKRKRFFRFTFSQTLSFLALYSLGSAGFLGLGGYLVTQNQLTLGQLVGAELILSLIFYSLLRSAYYLRVYYDLCANVEKISYFYRMPNESIDKDTSPETGDFDVSFNAVRLSYRDCAWGIHLNIPSGDRILAKTSDSLFSKIFIDVLCGHKSISEGVVTINGRAVQDYDLHKLRDRMFVIDTISIVEGKLADYFRIYCPNCTLSDIHHALAQVELLDVVNNLPAKIDTLLVPSGYPLSQEDVIRLKLAVALVAKPALLVITEWFDILPTDLRGRLLSNLCDHFDGSLIYFTHKKDWPYFNRHIYFNHCDNHEFLTSDDFDNFERANTSDMVR